MQRTLSEQRVLQQLGISNFRHMSKDKITKFASMLPYMDPDVAKKALEQFPEFKEMAGKLISEYKIIVDKALSENVDSQTAFYWACDSILEGLKQELQREYLSPEERNSIENRMFEVALMIGKKDSENKGFLIKVIAVAGLVVMGIIGTAATVLGSNTQASGFCEPGGIKG